MEDEDYFLEDEFMGPRRTHTQTADAWALKWQKQLDVEAAQRTAGLQTSRRTKQTAKHFVGIFGFLVAVILYCVVGGFLFNQLESENEIYLCKQARSLYQSGMTQGVKSLNNIRKDFTLSNQERIQAFEKAAETLRDAFVNSSWTGDDCDVMVSQWNVLGSTIWCLTVVTTIGYGHIAPKTDWGRMVTIGYALFGIPMTIVSLAKLGTFFTEIAHFSYHILCCCAICRTEKRVLDDNDKRHILRYYFKDKFSDFYKAAYAKAYKLKNNDPRREAFIKVFGESGDSSEETIDEEDLQMMAMEKLENVPWFVAIAIIFITVLGGGLTFSAIEDWKEITGIYFVFVTVSTIGFGDVYPSLKDPMSGYTQLRFLIWAILMVLGLAVMTMSLTLIQQDVGSKIMALASYCTRADGEKKGKAATEDTDSESDDCEEIGIRIDQLVALGEWDPSYGMEGRPSFHQTPGNMANALAMPFHSGEYNQGYPPPPMLSSQQQRPIMQQPPSHRPVFHPPPPQQPVFHPPPPPQQPVFHQQPPVFHQPLPQQPVFQQQPPVVQPPPPPEPSTIPPEPPKTPPANEEPPLDNMFPGLYNEDDAGVVPTETAAEDEKKADPDEDSDSDDAKAQGAFKKEGGRGDFESDDSYEDKPPPSKPTPSSSAVGNKDADKPIPKKSEESESDSETGIALSDLDSD